MVLFPGAPADPTSNGSDLKRLRRRDKVVIKDVSEDGIMVRQIDGRREWPFEPLSIIFICRKNMSRVELFFLYVINLKLQYCLIDFLPGLTNHADKSITWPPWSRPVIHTVHITL